MKVIGQEEILDSGFSNVESDAMQGSRVMRSLSACQALGFVDATAFDHSVARVLSLSRNEEYIPGILLIMPSVVSMTTIHDNYTAL
jgi:hypothetical protein